MQQVYMDHGATTPLHPEVIAVMTDVLTNHYGNPSSVHAWGRDAKKRLEEARTSVAKLIGAQPEEIFFTSGGTEADNMAILGVAKGLEKKGKHIITSAIEHHAVLYPCEVLKKAGYDLTILPVDDQGRVRPEDLALALREDTVLVSIMHANNEIGTLQPIAELARIAKERGVLFHTDAVQSVGKIPVNVNELGVDLLSFSAHKIYGPKGVGALYIRRGSRILPLTHGGGQERRRRPGTENLPGIVAFGKAAEIAQRDLTAEADRLTKLRDRLIDGLTAIPEVRLNGHRTERIPTNVNVSFRYIEGESLLLSLDLKGIAASSGSACTSGSLDPSHVLLAIGLSHEIAHGSLRLTLGRINTEDDVDYVLREVPVVVERLRSMSPLYNQK
ncbi:cysteine desulfurase NifS [Heliophilum fasciatum]|uniref:Cysteine desulfurase IscS n=1 Tax=Heliophilum fasciatum TaxID=35700 RepID=A0A4R2RMS8_9FIRM|nr:cysteine desulfurase NifS [Heliophilum fasciatum]MCW2278046.1 cysteine desulfurase [Heliophilum fasciatum]TCP64334.1 cysteine desulfurase [Heliophilum fasciatum]